jgi:ribosome biogenesis GTPase / thiamine phosphate phosphatase
LTATGDIHLHSLGWHASFAVHLSQLADPSLEPARVIIRQKNRYILSDGEREWEAEISGRIHYAARSSGDYPAVGDWVAVRKRPDEGSATIHTILARRSCFIRRNPGVREEEQIIAANIDVVFLVDAFDAGVNMRRLERYLVIAAQGGARPVIVLNKADLDPDADEVVDEVRVTLPGIPVVVTSAKKNQGLEALLEHLKPGETAALLGPSGAGKSTIANALLGEERFEIGEVREGDRRGRHTTSHRELVRLPSGGLLIDTPGMRELQLWDIDEEVQETFEDIEELALHCKFRDCRHGIEPGCAVAKAIEEGTLDPGRLVNYEKMQKELAFQERRTNKAAQLREKERWKKIMKDFKKGKGQSDKHKGY